MIVDRVHSAASVPPRPPCQHRLEKRPGIAPLLLHHGLGRPESHDLSPAVTSPRRASIQTRGRTWKPRRCRRGGGQGGRLRACEHRRGKDTATRPYGPRSIRSPPRRRICLRESARWICGDVSTLALAIFPKRLPDFTPTMPGMALARPSTLLSILRSRPSTLLSNRSKRLSAWSKRSSTVLNRCSVRASNSSRSLWTSLICRVRKPNEPSISPTRRFRSRISASTFMAMRNPYHRNNAAFSSLFVRDGTPPRRCAPTLPLQGRVKQALTPPPPSSASSPPPASPAPA